MKIFLLWDLRVAFEFKIEHRAMAGAARNSGGHYSYLPLHVNAWGLVCLKITYSAKCSFEALKVSIAGSTLLP